MQSPVFIWRAVVSIGLLGCPSLAAPAPRPDYDWYVDDANAPTGAARFAVAAPGSVWLGSKLDEELAEGYLYRLQDGRWSPVDNLPGPTSRAVVLDVDSGGGLWLARFRLEEESTYDGLQIDRFDGRVWRQATVTPGIWPQAMDMLSPQEGWLAGNHGLFLHYQGGLWRRVSLDEPADQLEGMNFLALAMVDADDGWAVGIDGLVARYLHGRSTPRQSSANTDSPMSPSATMAASGWWGPAASSGTGAMGSGS